MMMITGLVGYCFISLLRIVRPIQLKKHVTVENGHFCKVESYCDKLFNIRTCYFNYFLFGCCIQIRILSLCEQISCDLALFLIDFGITRFITDMGNVF